MFLSNTTNEDANLNYLKNRGNPGQWFQHKADYREDKPVPRIRVGGFEILEKLKPTIGEIIIPNKYQLQKSNDIHVRLTTVDAKKIADKFNFQEDKWFDFAGNLSYKPPKAPRKVRYKTAEEIAENNWQQKSHDWFSHNRPKTTASFAAPMYRCTSKDALDNCIKMRSSNLDEWFKNLSKKTDRKSQTAPNSPKSRVKFEGVDYALRARGIGAELLIHSTAYDQDYDDTALPYRCLTAEAGDNCRYQTGGSDMAKCMNNKNGVILSNDQSIDRVRSDEAREYLERSRSGTMNMSVDGTSVPLKPKVRPEAEEYYNKAAGSIGSIIEQNKNKGYCSPQPVARIRTTEAREAFETNKGVMLNIIGKSSYRAAVYKPKHQPRGIVGSEAKEIMGNSTGSSMKKLVENYKLPPNAPPRQRVGASGSEEGGLKRTSSVGHLLNEYGTKTTPYVPPLRLYGDAFEVAEKYRSKDFFKTIQQRPPSK